AKLLITIFLLCFVATGARAQTSNDVSWAKRVDTGSQVVTTLQFYFHDTLSGSNPSAVRVAQPQSSSSSLGGFGNLMMIDDPLTEGPEKNSKLIGHARGMYGQAAQNDLGLIMAVREMTIVGGTGLFRLARGYALAQTYWIDPTTGDAIVGYNATIVTYI
nr:dirigent protein 23-like [Tanacetum cinerariifolium]